jgi:dihydroorotate dehydrogenase
MTMPRTFFELRGNLAGKIVRNAGKIVRNNSSHMMRLPKKAVLRNNYYFNNTCNEELHKDFSREHPRQLIKNIARRIYQEEYQ